MSIEDYNYARDSRNAPAPGTTVTIDDVTIDLPLKWAVCSVCHGEGKHVNPNIDAGGLTSEDFCEDWEFGQDYMDGVYDITCNRCGGKRVEKVVDGDRMDKELWEAYEADLRAQAECRAEELAELRMGA